MTIILFQIKLSATHLVGGEISYEFAGIGINQNFQRYKITLKLYKDICTTTVVDEEQILIYLSDTIFAQKNLELDAFSFITNPDYECLIIPSGICVMESIYIGEIELPINNESYHLVFQTCCRSESLSNILNPELTGMTYSVEITSLAQVLKNSSPISFELPPTIICVNEYMDINILATDFDGDLLIYKLCSPSQLAEPGTIFQTFPPPPPPYPFVTFIAPEFTLQEPLGVNAGLVINQNTGLLTGIPNLIGTFVVGICIEEYRNGQLLSSIIRDFQFNVNFCSPKISALIDSDEIIENTYVYNICETSELTIQNQSTDTNYINNFFWTFDIDNQIDTFYEWNPTITFPHSGTFTGQLLLNPDEECGDTAHIIVNVSESLQADFAIDYDTCVGGAVDFIDQSIGQGILIEDWFWDFGDSTWSELPSPQHQYLQAGTQTTTLIITDENGCQDTLIKNFAWLPAPPIIVVAPSASAGCSPLDVFFENLSSPVDSTYGVLWDFGNGNMSTEISPSYVYPSEGVYDISVAITSPIGCQIDTTFYDLIKVTPVPHASFDWLEEMISNLQSTVHFQDLSSQEVIAWEWRTNQHIFSTEQNSVFIFQDTGYQQVTLTVFDKYNCVDSLTLLLDVVPESTYFLPNAFSPNGDGVNDIFFGKGILENIQFFEMVIYNRWGEVVFQTENPTQGWNGINIKSGKMANQGVYNCVINYRTKRNISRQFQQSIVLIK